MITSTISNTKDHLSELLARVRSGETLVITDRRTPIAKVECIRDVATNPHVLPAISEWNPSSILALPIVAPAEEGAGLVKAVVEERAAGW